jgi:general L-amino acid transport system substrate-binding protein
MRRIFFPPVLFLSIFIFIGLVARAHAASSTLSKVRAAGTLACGVDTEEPEWTLADAHGNHSAFDDDICKAVAVAVLGADAKATIKYFRDEASSLAALKSGAIDLLATASLNFRNDNGSFSFARPIFYDFQGFLVDKSLGITSPKDFAGKKVCFLTGTEIEAQVNDYMQREKINFLRGPFSEEGEMEAALITGNCAAITADVSQLAYERIAFKHMAKKFAIMSDSVASDPLAPAVRSDDPQWRAIVDWTMQALIQAEEVGVTQANLKDMKKSDDILVRRLLGAHRGWGQFIGLDDEWAARAIEAVGNYGEMFERDLGSGSAMKLERGANNLSTHGGLMYSNPIR